MYTFYFFHHSKGVLRETIWVRLMACFIFFLFFLKLHQLIVNHTMLLSIKLNYNESIDSFNRYILAMISWLYSVLQPTMSVQCGFTCIKSNDRLSRHSRLTGRKFVGTRDIQWPAIFAPPWKPASLYWNKRCDWLLQTSDSRHFLLCDEREPRVASEWIQVW